MSWRCPVANDVHLIVYPAYKIINAMFAKDVEYGIIWLAW